MKKFQHGSLWVLAIGLLATYVMPLHTAVAQSGPSLSVSPLVSEVNAEPGERITIPTDYSNIGEEDLNVSFKFRDFNPNINGSPEIITSGSNEEYGISDWFEPALPILIKENKDDNVRFAINVPPTTEPGTYYGLISAVYASTEGGTDLSTSLGTIVLLDIGEASYSGEIASMTNEFTLDEDKENLTASFDVTIRNTSSFAFRPTVTVQIVDQNDIVLHTLELDTYGNVLPASTRIFSFELDEEVDPEKSYSAQAVLVLPDETVINGEGKVVLYEATMEEPEEPEPVEESDDSQLPLIVGGGIGAVVLLSLMIILFTKKRRSKKAHSETMQENTFQTGAPGQTPPQAQPGQIVTPTSENQENQPPTPQS